MNAVNSVHLLIVFWTSTAVCRADVDLSSVSCEDVTGTVGKEVNFTCSVSLNCSEFCIKKYKFQYPEIYNDTEICKQVLPDDSCEQRNSFTCRYSATKAMTGRFRFFVQTTCGPKKTEFTVDIKEHQELKTEEDPGTEEIPESNGESNGNVTTAVVGCSIITIIIIIMMTIIYKTQSNYSNPCGLQRRMFLCLRHDEDNSNSQQQSTQNEINITDSTV